VNVLYLAHRLPYPPNKGDKIRSYHQLAYLSRRHRVWCACFVDDPADEAHLGALRDFCQSVAAIRLSARSATARGLVRLARGGTLTEGYYNDPHMWAVVRSWAASVPFDAVVVFSSGMAPYGLACPARRRVIDFCDWDSLKWADYARGRRGLRRRLFDLEARRLRRRERQWIEQYDASAVITRAEADDAPADRVQVVGNGVELRPYVPPPVEPRVGFVGAMDYAPNVEAVCRFAERIWPTIRQGVAGATFQIVGRRPTRQVRALAKYPGIEVVGEVADAGAYVDAIAVHVTPLTIARGLQNKVLEAMAAGRATVVSSAAARGIDGQDGRHYVIADEDSAIADAVVSLLQDPVRATALGRSARAFVAERFNWDREMARLEALLVDHTPVWNVDIPEPTGATHCGTPA